MSPLSETDRILITGASGFIGTNLIEHIKPLGAQLMNIDLAPPLDPAHSGYWKKGDIMDSVGISSIFSAFKPTHVVHLAARCDCDESTTVEAGYQANTKGTANVLEAIKATPEIRKAVITSSQFVFNKGAELPKGDSDYAPVTIYGESKIITEKLTRDAELSCVWTLIRPTNVWGPWHIRHTQQFFKILSWGLYVHPGREPVVRSYAYVGNVVDQVIRILEAEDSTVAGKTFYLGDPPLDILEWVNGFSLALKGREVRVIPRSWLHAAARAGDLVSKALGKPFFITSSRFTSMTSDYLTPMDKTLLALGPSRYTLQDGIRETIIWLKSRGRMNFPKAKQH